MVPKKHGEIRNLTATETRWKRLIIRWTRPKGFAAIVLFLLLSLAVELLMVYSFQMLGLVDPTVWTGIYFIPYLNWTFAVSLSPLFHLIPLAVIIVMLSSWAYLTKYTAFIQQRAEPPKRASPQTRRKQESRRFRSLKRFSKRLTRRLQRVGRSLKSGFQKIRGVSYISQRLHFARAAVRSAIVVLLVFLSIAFLLIIVEYPDLIHRWTVNLYRSSPALLNFVVGIGQWLRGVGEALPPLGGLGSGLINALAGVAPGFRHSLEGAGTGLAGPIAQLDVVGKYVLSQNLAAWTSALIALVYGAYASSRPSRRGKGR